MTPLDKLTLLAHANHITYTTVPCTLNTTLPKYSVNFKIKMRKLSNHNLRDEPLIQVLIKQAVNNLTLIRIF